MTWTGSGTSFPDRPCCLTAWELRSRNPAAAENDLSHVKALHRYLFLELYLWAGELRSAGIERAMSR